MAFKEATDLCAGSGVIYGAPDLVKVMELLNGKAITCCEPVLPRDTIFTISDATDCTALIRFDATCITTCNTRVITVPDFDLILLGTTTTQTITNKCISESTNTLTGEVTLACNTQEIWIGAEAMVPETTGGACFTTRELVTNDVMISTMKFDTGCVEGAQFTWTPPANWNAGTVRGKLYWTAAGGSCGQTIDFDFSGRSYANDCALDQTLDTGAQAITDTRLAAACDMHISSFSSAMTITNATAGEMVIFKLQRDVAADNLGVDAEIIGIIIEYGLDSVSSS